MTTYQTQKNNMNATETRSELDFSPYSPPCDCGNPNASWHGDRYGRREFSCSKCYDQKTKNQGKP